jgi:hypothetical protein
LEIGENAKIDEKTGGVFIYFSEIIQVQSLVDFSEMKTGENFHLFSSVVTSGGRFHLHFSSLFHLYDSGGLRSSGKERCVRGSACGRGF